MTAALDRIEVAGAVAGDSPLDRRLAALDLPKGGFTAAARADAADRLALAGLPHARDEYWRYTPPHALNAETAEPLPVPEDPQDAPLFEGVGQLRLVFVDGRFDAGASDPLALEGVELDVLSRADSQADHWAGEIYGALETAGQSPVRRPHAILNTLAAPDGVLIRVTGKPARPIHLVYRRSDAGADVYLRHVLRVEPGAELTLLETGMIGARSNVVIEADVAETGRLHHIAAKRGGEPKTGIGHIFARVGANALFKSFELVVDGRMMRNESVIDIVGDDSVAHVASAVLGDGADGRFHHDNTVFITHGAERCESRQVFKKVLRNGATGVFQGKILVKPGAQKTDGYQISQSLLLDGDSQFLAKPELEIYADDVKCSHGSTTGALDETALFYLRSRGVPQARAVVLLVLSFLADALEEVEDDDLRARISERLEAWLIQRAQDSEA